MSLHHFYWNGKERSVAVNKITDKVKLRFIDEEIIALGLEKICFAKGQSIDGFVNHYEGDRRRVINEIIHAVRERVDFIRFL